MTLARKELQGVRVRVKRSFGEQDEEKDRGQGQDIRKCRLHLNI